LKCSAALVAKIGRSQNLLQVVKGNLTQNRIAAEHGWFSGIQQMVPQLIHDSLGQPNTRPQPKR